MEGALGYKEAVDVIEKSIKGLERPLSESMSVRDGYKQRVIVTEDVLSQIIFISDIVEQTTK